jgi:Ca-activated chloride channel family protein
MRQRIQYLLLGLIGMACAAGALGQERVFSLRVDVQSVSLDVSVLDPLGQPLESLTQREFTIFEDGVEQEIKTFSSLDTPYNILLLFDRSGSTADQWRTMQRAASTFARNLRRQDRVKLASFEDGLTVLTDWNDMPGQTDRALLEILKRGPGGGTNLYWSLERATQREFRGTEGRRAVVVLTDGRDNMLVRQTRANGVPMSFEKDPIFQHTLAVARAVRIPIYFAALNTDQNPSDALGDDYHSLDNRFPTVNTGKAFLAETRKRMEQLAAATGGRVFYPKNLKDIVPVYDQISRDMSRAYSLSYISSNEAVSGNSHTIEVRVRPRGATVRQSRDSYVSP